MEIKAEKFGLKETLLEEILDLAKKYQVEKLILFGSRARGDYRERSDIDLAVQGGNVVRFSCDVQEDTYTLLMFDVVDLGGAVQEELRQSIWEEGVVLYEKSGFNTTIPCEKAIKTD